MAHDPPVPDDGPDDGDPPAAPPLPGDGDAPSPPPVASLSLERGGLIVYDPDNGQAWIQTDAPASLAAEL